MKSLRILIVTHSPLSPEFGAGQMAINLAEALREQGHDVTLWSPHPMPSLTRWWQGLQSIQLMRSKLDAFLEAQQPFDVIDIFAVLITKQVAQSALVVARSVQPEILYMVSNLKNPLERGLKKIALLPFSYLFAVAYTFLLFQGWRRANYILCLGSLEVEWMKKWFPWWRGKLISYANALSKADQAELTKIRLNRKNYETQNIQFLWIGRWVAHKGITELLNFIVKRAVSHPQDTFTIAGCGNNAEKDCPPELIQSGKLKILPSFERTQLYSLLANHDVGLFTSQVEGWGLVLNEMLESGMPVFATLAGGVPDLEPLFKESLKPFPAPSKFTLGTITKYEFRNEYYQIFSWSSIAKFYLQYLKKSKMNQKLLYRPILMKLKPLWLREKLFWKIYFNQTVKCEKLCEYAFLEFAPHVSMKLMQTDVSHKMLAFCGFYELQVSRYIANLAKAGSIMIDVGANYGYYSCLWAATNSRNRVIAFEASPRNILPLKQNLSSNGLENQVDIRETAVGKQSGSLLFNLGPNEQSGWGGLTVDNQVDSIEVPVVSLDETFINSKYERIDVLKIDTEGADTWVLQGAEKLLRQHKITHIFFEENLARMAELAIQPGQAQNLLMKCGYRVKRLGAGEWYATLA